MTTTLTIDLKQQQAYSITKSTSNKGADSQPENVKLYTGKLNQMSGLSLAKLLDDQIKQVNKKQIVYHTSAGKSTFGPAKHTASSGGIKVEISNKSLNKSPRMKEMIEH